MQQAGAERNTAQCAFQVQQLREAASQSFGAASHASGSAQELQRLLDDASHERELLQSKLSAAEHMIGTLNARIRWAATRGQGTTCMLPGGC